ncbi:enoyl-CoA hydratase/isomerase family protein [Halomarina halobia]|uniref:Enoyl-CoA hydratase/isomerase family protein n=1 Tax=Halomarina halobia TaxID=3033386 RepID=A0ABD6AFH5_9EURY|nr:enoyl-CoA hydratase-related protein [Halomarina sp. PSR21]
MREYDHLDVSLSDDVLTIEIDRPDNLNAVNDPLHAELSTVFDDAYEMDARVVVLTGKGDAFSAGGDVNWMKDNIENPENFHKTIREGEQIVESIVNLEKPIIAKVNGDATGLGATLALFCDIVMMSDDARIGDPHVKVALVAGDGGAVIWPLLTSLNKAKELLMTGDLISAKEAEELGLVNHVVPAEELDERTAEMIDKLASGPQTAIQFTKKTLNSWLELGNTIALQRGIALEAVGQQHPDHEEAVDAFLERRRPNFPSGRPPEK